MIDDIIGKVNLDDIIGNVKLVGTNPTTWEGKEFDTTEKMWEEIARLICLRHTLDAGTTASLLEASCGSRFDDWVVWRLKESAFVGVLSDLSGGDSVSPTAVAYRQQANGEVSQVIDLAAHCTDFVIPREVIARLDRFLRSCGGFIIFSDHQWVANTDEDLLHG